MIRRASTLCSVPTHSAWLRWAGFPAKAAVAACWAWTLLQAQNAPKPDPAKPDATQTSGPADSQKIEPLRQSVTVIGTITEEVPASITTLGRLQVQAQPGIDLDDRLRAVLGFGLFRRSSGIAANPTTQGISLRGLGSSGARRTLLLWDGIPVNSPFGGWIYWTRLAPEDMERIEISRGASTSVFGDKAMGGAVTTVSRPAEPWHLTLYAGC